MEVVGSGRLKLALGLAWSVCPVLWFIRGRRCVGVCVPYRMFTCRVLFSEETNQG